MVQIEVLPTVVVTLDVNKIVYIHDDNNKLAGRTDGGVGRKKSHILRTLDGSYGLNPHGLSATGEKQQLSLMRLAVHYDREWLAVAAVEGYVAWYNAAPLKLEMGMPRDGVSIETDPLKPFDNTIVYVKFFKRAPLLFALDTEGNFTFFGFKPLTINYAIFLKGSIYDLDGSSNVGHTAEASPDGSHPLIKGSIVTATMSSDESMLYVGTDAGSLLAVDFQIILDETTGEALERNKMVKKEAPAA